MTSLAGGAAGVLTMAALSMAACGRDDADGLLSHAEGKGLKADPKAAQVVLATVGEAEVTGKDFLSRVSQKSAALRARYLEPEHRKELLEELMEFEMLASEARRLELEQDPLVVRSVEEILVERVLATQVDEKVPPSAITDAQIRAYYDAHIDEFSSPERRRASQIVVESKELAKKLAVEIEQVQRNHAVFTQLAHDHSVDPVVDKTGGDLGYFTRTGNLAAGKIDGKVVEGVFALESLGDVAPIVETSAGFHLLQLTGKRKSQVMPLDQAGPQIRRKLWRDERKQRQEQFLTSLRERYAREPDWDALEKLDVVPASEVASNAPADQGAQ